MIKEVTNYQPGPRGINLADGSTVWIESGQTLDISKLAVKGDLPDFGKPSDQSDRDASEIDALRERVAVLEAENATLRDGKPTAPDIDLIRAAVEGLDPANDDHWTSAGLPDVSAVKAQLGADVTRAQITEAAPDAKRSA